ncbi:MAG: hypothetical protein MK212_11425 [Saprospiraceae bacterium]|nr:hypothetical protein [Saprospiraceae bacterium]
MATKDKYGKLKIMISIAQMLLSLFWIGLNVAGYIRSLSTWHLNLQFEGEKYAFFFGVILGLTGFTAAIMYLIRVFNFRINLLIYLIVLIFAVSSRFY